MQRPKGPYVRARGDLAGERSTWALSAAGRWRIADESCQPGTTQKARAARRSTLEEHDDG